MRLITKKSRKKIKWEEKYVKDLIKCSLSYKTKVSYCGLGFDEFEPRKYKELRESMAKIYMDVNVKIFGPANMTDFNNENIKKI